MDCSTPGLPVHHQLPEFTQIQCPSSLMPSNHLILCHLLLLPPSVFPSIKLFSNKSVLCIRGPKYWSFGFSISPFYEYSRLISFRMDWLDLLAVPGTLKSLLQHHSSKASILQRLAFFMVQLSHPYVTTGKTIALTRWTFVSPWRRPLQPTPVFLPGESPWTEEPDGLQFRGRKELDTTKRLSAAQHSTAPLSVK